MGETVEITWPWQYNFPPFFTIQPHAETRARQLAAWQALVLDYMRAARRSTLDVRSERDQRLFHNATIDRKLSPEAIQTVLEGLAGGGRAAAAGAGLWEVYWRPLEEWARLVAGWAAARGLANTVCTLYELVEGDDTIGEEFHGLEQAVLVKALRTLQAAGRCELIEFDDHQGVKFF